VALRDSVEKTEDSVGAAFQIFLGVKSDQAIVAVADVSQRIREVIFVAVGSGELFDVLVELVQKVAQTILILRSGSRG
jgi:hypothetical protein